MTSLSDLLGEGDVADDNGEGGAEPYVPESMDEPDPDATQPDSPDPSQDCGPRPDEGNVDASAPVEPEDHSTAASTAQPRSEPGHVESSAEAQEVPDDHVEYDMDGDDDFEAKGRITTDAQGNKIVVGADGEPLFGDETTETASTQSSDSVRPAGWFRWRRPAGDAGWPLPRHEQGPQLRQLGTRCRR